MTHSTSLKFGRALLAALALGFTATSAALAADTRYYVNDHLATTVGIADAAGEIAALEADAFGSPLAGASNADRFTGKPYDEDLGAYVFPFRNYRADEARWMSADPSGFPDGVNGNAYHPTFALEIDPLGLKRVIVETWYERITLHYVSVQGLAETVFSAIATYYTRGTAGAAVAGSGLTALSAGAATGTTILRNISGNIYDTVANNAVSKGWVVGNPLTEDTNFFSSSDKIGYTITAKYSTIQIWETPTE